MLYYLYYFTYIALAIMLAWCIYNLAADMDYEGLEMRKSSVNQKSYGIQEMLPAPAKAVDILARLDSFITKFVAYLDSKFPNDRRVKRLVNRLHDVKIEESPFEPDTSSYTINKGDLIALCVRSKEDKSFHDYQTLLFVVIHELAHVASIGRGHGPEFVDNFSWLLKEAHASGMYIPVDYSKNPITYCGVRVSNNPGLDIN
jgi:hypothetical protein